MELPNDETQVEEIGTALSNVQGLSLLKEAQQRRQARERTLFLDVPSWDGDLVCEYRVVSPDGLKKLAEKAMRRNRNGNAEAGANDVLMIIASAVGLYIKNPENGERVAIEDEFGHVSYNRIANILGKEDEIKSNVEAVRYLMGERDEDGGWVENIMAMSLHANAIAKWMKDPSKHGVEIDDLLGEL
jgi:hypothetical protein